MVAETWRRNVILRYFARRAHAAKPAGWTEKAARPITAPHLEARNLVLFGLLQPLIKHGKVYTTNITLQDALEPKLCQLRKLDNISHSDLYLCVGQV